MENKIDKIVIHHTGNSTEGRQFQTSNEYHREKFNWQGSLGNWIAYHDFIEKDGTYIKGRADIDGAPDELGHNFDGISVCLAGNFNTQLCTPAQLQTLGVLCYDLKRRYGLGLDKIFLHREITSTLCPGANLTLRVVRIATIKAESNQIKMSLLWIFEKLHLLR